MLEVWETHKALQYIKNMLNINIYIYKFNSIILKGKNITLFVFGVSDIIK